MTTAVNPGAAQRLVNALDCEAARYLAASAFALLVDLGTFSLALRVLGAGWAIAATLGFLAGALTAYALSVLWVFAERRHHQRPVRELGLFVLVGAAGLLVTQVVLWVGISRLHMQPELVRLAAAAVTFFFNYLLRATILFRAPDVEYG